MTNRTFFIFEMIPATLQKLEVCAQLNALEKRFKKFFIIHFVQLYSFTKFYLMNAQVYVDIDQGIH